jgi:hypothetical protein
MNHLVRTLISIKFLLLASAISFAEDEKSIPFVGDEVSLARIKASPRDYIGKIFVICGGVSISDYFNFKYKDSEETHYSLKFNEANKDGSPSTNDCWLYLPRDLGKPIVDGLIEKEEQSSDLTLILTRATVTILADRYDPGGWNMFEVIDLQFPTEGWTDWKEGMISEFLIPKKRVWKDRTGTHEISATFKEFRDGHVLLELEDGTTRSVKAESLSDADISYIAERLKIQEMGR